MLMCIIGQIKEFSFEYIAERLRYSRVRDCHLQPLLKNMIKAEKNLGAGCNYNIISHPGSLNLNLQFFNLTHSLTHYLDITWGPRGSPAGLAAERLEMVAMQLAAQENKFHFQLRVKVHKLDFG